MFIIIIKLQQVIKEKQTNTINKITKIDSTIKHFLIKHMKNTVYVIYYEHNIQQVTIEKNFVSFCFLPMQGRGSHKGGYEAFYLLGYKAV
jgi:hypothetical protein